MGASKIPESPKTLEQRLEEMERKVPLLLERIQKGDEIQNEFKSLNKKLEEYMDICRDRSAACQKDNDRLVRSNQIIRALQEQADGLTQRVQTMQSVLEEKFQDQINSLDSSVTTAIHTCMSTIKGIEYDLEKKMSVDRNEVKAFSQDLKDIEKMFEVVFARIESIQTERKTDVKTIKEMLQLVDDDVELIRRDMDDNNANVDQLRRIIGSCVNEMESTVKNSKKQLSDEIHQIVSKAKEEFTALPASADSIKASVDQKLESAALDAKNAYLKATSAERAMAVVEKKLENLNLLIKNMGH
jgi:hypothetical protein